MRLSGRNSEVIGWVLLATGIVLTFVSNFNEESGTPIRILGVDLNSIAIIVFAFGIALGFLPWWRRRRQR